jgi:hypothetical protein
MKTMNIIGHRLYNQGISASRFTKPEEVVGWLGAVQAQDYLGSLWAMGLRTRNATEKIVEKALAERKVIRTWVNRGTLHFIPADDAHWMLGLLAPRIIANNAGRLRRNYDLDDQVLSFSAEIFSRVLIGGRSLSRSALYQTLEKAGISTARQRGPQILWHLALEGLICFGPRQGKQPTFVLLDEWTPSAKKLGRDEALAELARRYFASHGPATLQDFIWWSGLTRADAEAGLEMAKNTLVSETIGEQTYWFSAPMDNENNIRPDAYLLPPFDEYIVAYTDRKEVLDPSYIGRADFINSYANPTMIAEGQMVGTWKRTIKKDGVEVNLNPFIELRAHQRNALELEVLRYADFLGLPVVEGS